MHKHIHALLLGVSDKNFDAIDGVEAMAELLGRVDPHAYVKRCSDLSHDGVLGALDDWIASASENDACVFYYTGHGGRGRLVESGQPSGSYISYLTCDEKPQPFSHLIDRELSDRITGLHSCSKNVTTIIDSCFSGVAVRDLVETQTVRRIDATWVRELLAQPPATPLALESHPGIVRLAAASPRATAHLSNSAKSKQWREGPSMGLLTRALIAIFEQAGDDWWRMTWNALAHAVRQRVFSEYGAEHQWVSLAGPRDRLLFSTARARPAETVGYVFAKEQHWIRAGQLQGVERGDRWAIASPFVDHRGWHPSLAEAVIEEPGPNRARVKLEQPEQQLEGLVVAAYPLKLARRARVELHDSVGELSKAIGSSAWLKLQAGGRHLVAKSDEHYDTLEVLDITNEWATLRVRDGRGGRARVLEILEDRARVERLRRTLDDAPVPDTKARSVPLTWCFGVRRDGSTSKGLTDIACGSALWVEVCNPVRAGGQWFISVILVDVLGTPWLLNASQPDGVELGPCDRESIGRRIGVEQGFPLDWPADAICDGPGKLELMFISSNSALQLGHITRAHPRSESAALRSQRLETRAEDQPSPKRPTPLMSWRVERVQLKLLPPA